MCLENCYRFCLNNKFNIKCLYWFVVNINCIYIIYIIYINVIIIISY